MGQSGDPVLDLVSTALDELASSSCLLSGVVSKAIRVARLLDDYDDLWWMQMEIIPLHGRGAARKQVLDELRPHYRKEDFRAVSTRIADLYFEERGIPEIPDTDESSGAKGYCVDSVVEIEQHIQLLRSSGFVEGLLSRAGERSLEAQDLIQVAAQARGQCDVRIAQLSSVLARIRYRVYQYLARTEKRLYERQLSASVFERNRQYVDEKLREVSSDASGQLQEAMRRVGERGSEARSHALLSCRRALKSVADAVYPPVDTPVHGTDGRARELTDEKYVSRLWQFVNERAGQHRAGELLLAQVRDLGNRVDAVYGLSNKGTHSDVSEFEANQCVAQTYMLIGDILRLAEGDSAIGAETEEEGK